MLTTKECERLLNKNNEIYTKQQLAAISELVTELSKIYLENIKCSLPYEKSSNLH